MPCLPVLHAAIATIFFSTLRLAPSDPRKGQHAVSGFSQRVLPQVHQQRVGPVTYVELVEGDVIVHV